MPVSSAILTPKSREMIVHEGTIEIKGWAYSGGGRWIERVEVSPDGRVLFLVFRRLFTLPAGKY